MTPKIQNLFLNHKNWFVSSVVVSSQIFLFLTENSSSSLRKRKKNIGRKRKRKEEVFEI
jgi:hypothetical protein